MKKILATILILTTNVAAAEPDNKWTFGIGLGNQTIADYRGSSYYQTQFLPIPFVYYHGDIIKIDRDGARGELWKNDWVEFNISLDASLNGHGDNNPVRAGMPKLDSAVEIGPSVNIQLSGEDNKSGWFLRFPLRGIYTIGSDGFNNIGYVFSPKLTWKQAGEDNQWRANVNIGPMFSTREYHEYYYSVAPAYATANRPTYAADAGYSGSFIKWSIEKQTARWWFETYVRYDNLAGATFIDSPLIEEKDSASFGVALVRLLDF